MSGPKQCFLTLRPLLSFVLYGNFLTIRRKKEMIFNLMLRILNMKRKGYWLEDQ